MKELLIVMSITSFIMNCYGLIAKWNGINIFFIFLFKLFHFIGVIVPVIYWLKLLNII